MDTMYLSAHKNLFKGTNRIIIGVKSGFIPRKSDYLCIEESKHQHIVLQFIKSEGPHYVLLYANIMVKILNNFQYDTSLIIIASLEMNYLLCK